MLVPSASIGLVTPVPATTQHNSKVILTGGLNKGSAGLASSQAGTLSVQRYVDPAGLVPLGAALTVAVVANTPVSVGWSDGLPSSSIVMSFNNTSGSAANLTDVVVDLAP